MTKIVLKPRSLGMSRLVATMQEITGAEIFAGFMEDGRSWAVAHAAELEELVGLRIEDLKARGVRRPLEDREVRKEFFRLRARHPEAVFGTYAYLWLIERRLRGELP